MPMTRSGRDVAAPRRVIEIDDVLLARIASGGVCSSMLPEQVELRLEVLGRGFDRDCDVELFPTRPRVDVREDVAALFFGHPSLLDRAVEVAFDRRQTRAR